jgi:choline dehydrogenase-like flavoprotein
MIQQLSNRDDVTYDLCVVGAGPLGIILTLEYARKHPDRKVLLLEFGKEQGEGANSLDDSIHITHPTHHHSPYECTNKGLGGTSSTWGGRCVMYDEVDFTDRPILDGQCTWDLEFLRACEPYVSRATDYFECGNGPFNLRGSREWGEKRIAEGFVDGEVSDSVVERWSMPTRFGKRYRDELRSTENITVVCGVEVRDLISDSANGTIECLRIRNRDTGEHHDVKAKDYVIAAGTQESTRILLRNTQIFKSIGGAPQALGRYYQGHLSGKIASVKFNGEPKRTEYGLLKDSQGIFFRRRFQFSRDLLEREDLLNTAIWLDNPLYHDPSHHNGTLSMFYLAMISPIIGKRLAPRAIANSITKGKIIGIHKHLWNILKDIPQSLLAPSVIFYKRYCVERKLPQIFLYNPQNIYALHYHAEQVPSASNRMKLGADGETLEIHYEPSEADILSVIKVHELLDKWLIETNCGRLDYWFPQGELEQQVRAMAIDGIHQSGTTRIANRHEEGVVDRDLRVWGIPNLYICSGSVLPTSSQANPTFFTGVLAVKLANSLD